MFRNLLALLIAGQPVATHRLALFPPVQSKIASFTSLSFRSQRRWYYVSQPACPAHRRSTRCYTSACAFSACAIKDCFVHFTFVPFTTAVISCSEPCSSCLPQADTGSPHRLALLKPCHCLSNFTNTHSFSILYFNKYDTRKAFLSAAEFPP